MLEVPSEKRERPACTERDCYPCPIVTKTGTRANVY